MSALKLCFAGTPAFAAEHLAYLVSKNFEIAAVYTQPDRPSGRGKKLQPSPVKQVALDAGLLVKQPTSLRGEEAAAELREIAPDLLIVVAYGLILPQSILDIPHYGCINVHASLLPRWRGAAPIERSILAGDKESGVTIMQMDAGLDTGPMLYKSAVVIEPEDDRVSLTDKLSLAGQEALVYTLENLASLRANSQEQDDTEATYADKLAKEEAHIDWTQSADRVLNMVRAGVGRTPAFTTIGDDRIRILRASVGTVKESVIPGTVIGLSKVGMEVMCADKTVHITQIQLPGKKPIDVRDFVNSNSNLIAVDTVFNSPSVS